MQNGDDESAYRTMIGGGAKNGEKNSGKKEKWCCDARCYLFANFLFYAVISCTFSFLYLWPGLPALHILFTSHILLLLNNRHLCSKHFLDVQAKIHNNTDGSFDNSLGFCAMSWVRHITDTSTWHLK